MKKKYIISIILAIILLLTFGIYYIYMQYFNGEIEEICDAKKQCPGGGICVQFPNLETSGNLQEPTCATQEIIDDYQCPEGRTKRIFESLPTKIYCNINEV